MKIILDFLRQFNWIDIFILIVFIRISLIALKNGLPTELFKLTGTFAAFYLALHHYASLSRFFLVRIGVKDPVDARFELTAFILLGFLGYAAVYLLRLSLNRFVKTEVVATVSKWGGFSVGLLRSLLLASLLLCGMYVSQGKYFIKSVNHSLSGSFVAGVDISVYRWVWRNVMSKFMASEKFNSAVDELGKERRKPAAKKK